MTNEELEKIDVKILEDSGYGACFHGEVWVSCPYCRSGHEMVGSNDPIKDGYFIIECEKCGKIYRDKR